MKCLSFLPKEVFLEISKYLELNEVSLFSRSSQEILKKMKEIFNFCIEKELLGVAGMKISGFFGTGRGSLESMRSQRRFSSFLTQYLPTKIFERSTQDGSFQLLQTLFQLTRAIGIICPVAIGKALIKAIEVNNISLAQNFLDWKQPIDPSMLEKVLIKAVDLDHTVLVEQILRSDRHFFLSDMTCMIGLTSKNDRISKMFIDYLSRLMRT